MEWFTGDKVPDSGRRICYVWMDHEECYMVTGVVHWETKEEIIRDVAAWDKEFPNDQTDPLEFLDNGDVMILMKENEEFPAERMVFISRYERIKLINEDGYVYDGMFPCPGKHIWTYRDK